MATVLVVEDDRQVAEFIVGSLREHGYSVDSAGDGEEALKLAQFRVFDVIILDMMLPKKDGLEVVSELRNRGETTPVLILTSRQSLQDRVRGLDAGADDYLGKPFALEELHARVRALLRRGDALSSMQVSCGPLELDRIKHSVSVGDKVLDLSRREFQLLEYLMLRPNVDVGRTEIMEQVWGLSFNPGTNFVDVHVFNLRKKLKEAGHDGLITTVRGVGFRIDPPDSSDSGD